MSRSTPAVAVLLLLALTGGPAIAAACEIACLSAAPASRTVRSETATIQPASGCHESRSVPVDIGARIRARSPHAACGHEGGTTPFVVAAKFVRGVDTQTTGHALSAEVEAVSSMTTTPPLREHAPPGVSAVRVVPLRI
jgi:hypothetical protein